MLNKSVAIKLVKKYLNDRHIQYASVNESKKPILVDSIDCLVISCYAERVLGRWIEMSLRFREEHVYLMAYYSQIFSSPEKYNEISRMLNHINAHLHYNTILNHNMVLDEETGDIYNGVLIRYEILENCFYDVMEYILHFQKQLLEDVGIPLVMLKTSKWDLITAKKYIEEKMK